jgi:hypothetical protein
MRGNTLIVKERDVVLTKVKWPLLDGLKEKQNFLNMIRDVVEKYVHYGVISKMSKDSHSEDYNSFQYTYKDFGLCLNFIHSRAKLYFLINDPEEKYKSFERVDIWPQNAVIDIFDLNTRHFFPLETHEQVIEIQKFFESCLDKIDKNT